MSSGRQHIAADDVFAQHPSMVGMPGSLELVGRLLCQQVHPAHELMEVVQPALGPLEIFQ